MKTCLLDLLLNLGRFIFLELQTVKIEASITVLQANAHIFHAESLNIIYFRHQVHHRYNKTDLVILDF